MKQKNQEKATENILGSRLRKLLQEHNMTQADLGAMIGLSQSTVNGYITGMHDPDISILKNLCSIFHVSSDYLIGLSDYKEIDPPFLSIEESSLLEAYNFLTPVDRDFLINEANTLKRKHRYVQLSREFIKSPNE
jgi:transcriptional regulator with XRE-family HTH domain